MSAPSPGSFRPEPSSPSPLTLAPCLFRIAFWGRCRLSPAGFPRRSRPRLPHRAHGLSGSSSRESQHRSACEAELPSASAACARRAGCCRSNCPQTGRCEKGARLPGLWEPAAQPGGRRGCGRHLAAVCLGACVCLSGSVRGDAELSPAGTVCACLCAGGRGALCTGSVGPRLKRGAGEHLHLPAGVFLRLLPLSRATQLPPAAETWGAPAAPGSGGYRPGGGCAAVPALLGAG